VPIQLRGLVRSVIQPKRKSLNAPLDLEPASEPLGFHSTKRDTWVEIFALWIFTDLFP
jgi:hypothetical protein